MCRKARGNNDDEHEPQKHQKRVVQEGGDRQGKKGTKRIKAVGTGCYVDMTRQTTGAFFSLFYSPSSPLGSSDGIHHFFSTFLICFLFFYHSGGGLFILFHDYYEGGSK